jgi:hypothetical protein
MSLLEVLVSTALTLVLSGTVLSLLSAGQTIARTQPERADLQQRARIALQILGADLRDAGAGIDRAPAVGPLNASFPPIAPSADGGVTVWRAVGGAAQATLSIAAAAPATLLTVADSPSCPPGQGACAFAAGDTVLAFGTGECRAAVRVASVAADVLQLAAPAGCALPAGAVVAEGVARTYFVDAAARQLKRRDESSGSVAPVLDGVASLSTALFADAAGAIAIAGTSDADLMRVRRVRLTLRLAASNPLLRIGDLETIVDAVPRNLQGN